MFYKISVAGTGATTGAASASVAIPNDSSGNRAKYLLVTAQGSSYVLPGASGVTATTSSPIVNAGQALLLDVSGHTHIAHLQLTAGQRVVFTPVEL